MEEFAAFRTSTSVDESELDHLSLTQDLGGYRVHSQKNRSTARQSLQQCRGWKTVLPRRIDLATVEQPAAIGILRDPYLLIDYLCSIDRRQVEVVIKMEIWGRKTYSIRHPKVWRRGSPSIFGIRATAFQQRLTSSSFPSIYQALPKVMPLGHSDLLWNSSCSASNSRYHGGKPVRNQAGLQDKSQRYFLIHIPCLLYQSCLTNLQ